MRTCTFLCTAILLLSVSPVFAQTRSIDFEDYAGPSRFDAAQEPVRAQAATFTGGQILRGSALATSGKTAVYATSNECAGCSPAISIQFNERVSNVEVSFQSEQSFLVSYATEDAQGNLQQVSLPAAVDAGTGTVSLPAANIRQVTLSAATPEFSLAVGAVTFATTGTAVLIDPLVAGLLSGYAVEQNM